MNQHAGYAAAAYRRAATAVRPTVAVVRLYDKSILHIGLATAAIEARRPEQAFIELDKATTILRGLQRNLDHDQGGALADRLSKIYTSNILALHTSFGKPDAPERYRKIVEGLQALRDAWIVVAQEEMGG